MERFLSSALLALIATGATAAAGEKPTTRSDRMPAFSWDTVPVCVHAGRMDRLLTDEQVRSLAERYPLVTLEKAHGWRRHDDTETATLSDAKRLRALAPDITVCAYMNTFIAYPFYRTFDRFEAHPEWTLGRAEGSVRKKAGRWRYFDLRQPDLRSWWLETVEQMVGPGRTDGLFLDALLQVQGGWIRRSLGDDGYEELQKGLVALLRETRQRLGPEALLVYNGMRSHDVRGLIGTEWLPLVDGVMVEHFTHFHSASPESIASDIERIEETGRAGKLVQVKGWPGFDWMDEDVKARSEEENRRLAAEALTFPLACFLVAAQEYAYFCYSWGYRPEHGALDWFPEFDRPLGPPLGAARRDRWQFIREFEHANVEVDVETRQARIDWR